MSAMLVRTFPKLQKNLSLAAMFFFQSKSILLAEFIRKLSENVLNFWVSEALFS